MYIYHWDGEDKQQICKTFYILKNKHKILTSNQQLVLKFIFKKILSMISQKDVL